MTFSCDRRVRFIAQLTISSSGDAEYGPDGGGISSGSVPVTPGVWNHYDFVLDFQNDTATAFINSTLIGSDAFATHRPPLPNLISESTMRLLTTRPVTLATCQ